MSNASDPNDLDFVQGEILALQALLLSVAQTMPKEEFRDLGVERLQRLHVTLSNASVPDSQLAGVEAFQNWLTTVTE